MFSLSPSLDFGVASANLAKLLKADIDANLFQAAIRSLQTRFSIYATTCPAAFIAPSLVVTPEIRRQSELYLPITEISRIFNSLYRNKLTYPPVLSSTPFHKALSWADVYASLPLPLQFSSNPAILLEAVLSDQELLTEFLFASFLPRRFYGGFGRYSGQVEFIRGWIGSIKQTRRGSGDNRLRCLDAACGTGEDTYGLANLLMEAGFASEEIRIEGWTLEPLEIWTAAHCRFPHDKRREANFRRETSRIFELRFQTSVSFRCVDLTEILCNPVLPPHLQGEDGAERGRKFDLIICNGLLGGPIISETEKQARVVSSLACHLAPGGILLAADSFHGGWKLKCRNVELKSLFLEMGLKAVDAGEGVGGVKL